MAHLRSPTCTLGDESLSTPAWFCEPVTSILTGGEELVGVMVKLEGSGALA